MHSCCVNACNNVLHSSRAKGTASEVFSLLVEGTALKQVQKQQQHHRGIISVLVPQRAKLRICMLPKRAFPLDYCRVFLITVVVVHVAGHFARVSLVSVLIDSEMS